MSHPSNADNYDELTSTAFQAVQSLPATRKANLLLDTSVALIEAGECVSLMLPRHYRCNYQRTSRYGDKVENFLDVYMRAPHLPKHDLVQALRIRGSARQVAGDNLLVKAQEGPFSDQQIYVVILRFPVPHS
jgi:hypothetical protein